MDCRRWIPSQGVGCGRGGGWLCLLLMLRWDSSEICYGCGTGISPELKSRYTYKGAHIDGQFLLREGKGKELPGSFSTRGGDLGSEPNIGLEVEIQCD